MAITPQQLLDTIACVGTALEKADASRKAQESQQEKVAQAQPRAQQALLRSGLVEPHETEELARVLADPATTLELLAKVANHYAAQQAELGPVANSTLGHPAGDPRGGSTKQGSYRYPGQRDGYSEADRVWFRMTTGKDPE